MGRSHRAPINRDAAQNREKRRVRQFSYELCLPSCTVAPPESQIILWITVGGISHAKLTSKLNLHEIIPIRAIEFKAFAAMSDQWFLPGLKTVLFLSINMKCGNHD